MTVARTLRRHARDNPRAHIFPRIPLVPSSSSPPLDTLILSYRRATVYESRSIVNLQGEGVS